MKDKRIRVELRCDKHKLAFDSRCQECKRSYRDACGRSREGHNYAMIYNDGETCLRCGHHREINERSVSQWTQKN
jgi:hypothetical protein